MTTTPSIREDKEISSSERCALPSSETGSSAPPEGWREQAARTVYDAMRKASDDEPFPSFDDNKKYADAGRGANEYYWEALKAADALAAIVPAHKVETPFLDYLDETIQWPAEKAVQEAWDRTDFQHGYDCATNDAAKRAAEVKAEFLAAQPPLSEPSPSPPLRHYPRRVMTGAIEVVDRGFDFVRCILPYDYAYTSNSQQWHEANLICAALEGPMSAQGVVRITVGANGDQDAAVSLTRDDPKIPYLIRTNNDQ